MIKTKGALVFLLGIFGGRSFCVKTFSQMRAGVSMDLCYRIHVKGVRLVAQRV